MKEFLDYKRIFIILDEAKCLVDSDRETIEWIEDEFKKEFTSQGSKE